MKLVDMLVRAARNPAAQQALRTAAERAMAGKRHKAYGGYKGHGRSYGAGGGGLLRLAMSLLKRR